MNPEQHRCPICEAELASSAELVRHERAEHTRRGAATRLEQTELAAARRQPRQNRMFTRSSKE
jgi:hypothetical protein